MKVIFWKSDGRLLGAQVLGEDGVPKRIDSFAMAIQAGFTIYDLEESELSYAPPFGSAKNPVNFAGMVAVDVLRGDMPLCHWDSVDGEFLLDVRNPRSLPSNPFRARSTSRCRNSAHAWANSRGPRDPHHLPLRPARLLRDAYPFAEWVQSAEYLRRHAVTFASCGGYQIKAHKDNRKKRRSAIL